MCEDNALEHLTFSQFKVLFCNLILQFCFMTLLCNIAICLVMPWAVNTNNLVLHSMPFIVIVFLYIQIVISLVCFIFLLS
jgi:heme/copper-type cytochrome/quinol oxidase subunit 4